MESQDHNDVGSEDDSAGPTASSSAGSNNSGNESAPQSNATPPPPNSIATDQDQQGDEVPKVGQAQASAAGDDILHDTISQEDLEDIFGSD